MDTNLLSRIKRDWTEDNFCLWKEKQFWLSFPKEKNLPNVKFLQRSQAMYPAKYVSFKYKVYWQYLFGSNGFFVLSYNFIENCYNFSLLKGPIQYLYQVVDLYQLQYQFQFLQQYLLPFHLKVKTSQKSLIFSCYSFTRD